MNVFILVFLNFKLQPPSDFVCKFVFFYVYLFIFFCFQIHLSSPNTFLFLFPCYSCDKENNKTTLLSGKRLQGEFNEITADFCNSLLALSIERFNLFHLICKDTIKLLSIMLSLLIIYCIY